MNNPNEPIQAFAFILPNIEGTTSILDCDIHHFSRQNTLGPLFATVKTRRNDEKGYTVMRASGNNVGWGLIEWSKRFGALVEIKGVLANQGFFKRPVSDWIRDRTHVVPPLGQ